MSESLTRAVRHQGVVIEAIAAKLGINVGEDFVAVHRTIGADFSAKAAGSDLNHGYYPEPKAATPTDLPLKDADTQTTPVPVPKGTKNPGYSGN